MTLALFTTMRKGEIVALRWENVDLVRNVIRVRHSFSRIDGFKAPKSRAGVRDIAMAEPVRRVLEFLHEASGRPAAGFVLHPDGEPERAISIGGIWMCTWAPLMKAAGLLSEDDKMAFTFHQMRHAAVSLLIEQGLDPMLIKQLAGHSSIKMTMDVYGYLFPEDGRTRAAMTGVAAQFDVRFDAAKAPLVSRDATKCDFYDFYP